MKATILLFAFALFCSVTLCAQEKSNNFSSLTSETKYEDEYPFKTKVFTLGLSVLRDISEEDSPTAFFLSGGYEFRKLYDDLNLYCGIGPRARVGWMSGDDVLYTNSGDLDFSFNSFSWGVSVIPSVGLILEQDNYISIYLEGELGVLNHHTRAKLAPLEGNSVKNRHDYLKLNMALRAGLRGNVSSKLEASVWVGLSNVNTKDAIGKIKFGNYNIEKFPLFGEFGVAIGF